MSTLADLSAAQLDLKFTRGNQVKVQFTFNISLAGYSGWAAKAKALPGDNVDEATFTVDTSQQGSNVITITLPGSLSAAVQNGWKWDMVVNDPTGAPVTFVGGRMLTVDSITP